MVLCCGLCYTFLLTLQLPTFSTTQAADLPIHSECKTIDTEFIATGAYGCRGLYLYHYTFIAIIFIASLFTCIQRKLTTWELLCSRNFSGRSAYFAVGHTHSILDYCIGFTGLGTLAFPILLSSDIYRSVVLSAYQGHYRLTLVAKLRLPITSIRQDVNQVHHGSSPPNIQHPVLLHDAGRNR